MVDFRQGWCGLRSSQAMILSRLASLVDAVGRAPDLGDVYAHALDALVEVVGADRAAVLLFDRAGVMRFVAACGLSDAYRAAAEGHSPWAPDASSPRPVLVSDAGAEPSLAALRGVFAAEGIGALAFFPLVHAGRLIGKFMLYYDAPHTFADAEVQLVEVVAAQVAFAIGARQHDAERTELLVREQDARAEAEAGRRRVALLAEATTLLAASLDYERTLATVARLAVPSLADWAIVYLGEPDGAVRRIAVAHSDPAREELLARLSGDGPPEAMVPDPVTRVVETGDPLLVAEISDQGVAHNARGSEHLALMRQLDPRSAMIVPLIGPSGMIGAISFVSATPERRFSDDDLAFAEELARRCAVAVENSRLHTALRESEARFRRIAEDAPDVVYRYELVPERRYTYVNQACERLWGYPPAAFYTDPDLPLALVHPEDRGLLDRLRVGDDFGHAVTLRWRHADGGTVWTEFRRAAVYDEEGHLVAIEGVGRDITDRVRAEEELREGASRLRLVLYAVGVGLWEWLVGSDELRWSESLEPLHGLAPGEFDGTFAGFLRAVHPADRDRLMDDIQAALAGGTGFSTEFRVIWPDGGVHWVAGIGRVARDADGRVDRMLGLGLDVTARRRGEERMRRLQEITAQLARSLDADELLAAIASAASDLLDVAVGAVFLLDADPAAGFVLAAGTGIDPAHRGALRLPRHGSLAGRALDAGRTLVVDDAAADPGTALPAVLTGQSSGSEIAAPILDERPVGVVKAFSPTLRRFDRDDVELLSALASAAGIALRNARLYREAGAAVAARDEFISVAAHELRTPVTALRGHAQLLERTKRRGELTDDRLDLSIRVLVESSKRLTGLVDDLLDVSRIQSGRLVLRAERMNLRDVVDRVVANRMVLGTTGHDIVVVGSAPCPVNADRDRIEQVLDNLVENAIKYSPAGGTIRIELAADGTAASLRVIDAGIGLPAGGAAAIFEPFGRAPNAVEQGLPGLGLGLYICRTIVEAHGGRIWAESAGEHRGTVVALELPCASPVAGG